MKKVIKTAILDENGCVLIPKEAKCNDTGLVTTLSCSLVEYSGHLVLVSNDVIEDAK